MSPPVVRIATRGSPLALAQTELVRSALAERNPDRKFEIRVFTTKGDRVLDRPLPEIGGTGLFTEELEEALRKEEVAMAVHSVKDLPVDLPPGLVLGGIPRREDPWDVLVSRDGHKLADLPAGSKVGTSSPRRRSQLLLLRSDLEVVEIRGNVQTRLRVVKEGRCDATLLALAGLRRLGLEAEVTEVLDVERFIPPAGQGAMGIEVRMGDADVGEVVSSINDEATRAEIEAERACLAALGGGCKTPIGAVGRVDGDRLLLKAGVFSPGGDRGVRAQAEGPVAEAEFIGKKAAADLLGQGAGAILVQ